MAKGKKTGGRKAGTPNKVTALLKDAIIDAAELEGEDGKGKDGVVGYCRMLARSEKKAFVTLMGKVLPTQVTGKDGEPIKTNSTIVFVPVGPDEPDTD